MTETTQDKMSYRKVLEGLLRMHELSAAGAHETDEIKRLRDAIDEPYSELSAEEREIIEGLSADLFDIENIACEPANDHVPEGDHAMAAAVQAQNSGNYEGALKLLRQSKPQPESRIAFLRGRIWSERGEPKVALLFFNHAAKLDPENDEYRARARDSVIRANPGVGQK